jgi:hypothetical protein
MPPARVRQFDVVRHRVRGLRVPYLLVLQHHDVPSPRCIVAPLSPSRPGDHDVVAPRLVVDGVELRARLLDMASVPPTDLLEAAASALSAADRITDALDVIFGGYPVRRPR